MPPEAQFEGLALAGELREFGKAWVSRGWSWDARLECVASTFALEWVEEARMVVARTFPRVFTHDAIASSPAVIQQLAERTGGVRSDQFIVTTEYRERLAAYGLWWPWGGEGSNVSLRVGLLGELRSGDEFAFRDLFNALS